jgi:archaellum component FlaC
VNTKVWIDRDTALSGQYVNIYATGLPLPEFHNSTYYCKTGGTIKDDHNWALALDFGPNNASASNKYWVFEKGTILNNEFDYAWFMQLYLPFAYWFNHQAPTSPTWAGTLYWKDAQGEFHTGSQFLKVPVVLPGAYTISLYEFNMQTDKDDQQYLATTSVNVIKDPLYVRASAGTLYFKGENVTAYAEIDLDGTATNPTDISFMLYHEDTFVTSLTSKAITEGLYAATFTCPSETGNYFVKVSATKALGGGNALSGFGATSFTVSPTLDGLNATLTAVSSGIATINSTVGTLTLNLNDVKGTVTKIDGNVATIETDIGNIEADVSTIKSQLVTVNNNEATIMTALGTVTTKLDNIGTQITQISADQVLIKTTVGDIKGTITSVNADTTNIKTSIGELSAKTDSIKAQAGNPVGIGLSVIAAVAAIVAAILIFRKLYT